MSDLPSESTCWEIVRDAADGNETARNHFARRYEPIVRRYLGHRWRGQQYAAAIDDAVQEAFVELFRQQGALERVDPAREGGFRPFFYGVIRNVALRFETRVAKRGKDVTPSVVWPEGPASDDPSLSAVFERAWLDAMLVQAVRELESRAQGDTVALQRVEILRLRFGDDRPYTEISRTLGIREPEVYREATRAREEFKAALLDVIARDNGGTPKAIERECREVLERLGRAGAGRAGPRG